MFGLLLIQEFRLLSAIASAPTAAIEGIMTACPETRCGICHRA